MSRNLLISALLLTLGCAPSPEAPEAPSEAPTPMVKTPDGPYLVVLGVAQDAGVPQAGTRAHPAWRDPSRRRHAACLALVDPRSGRRWMFDATPDLKHQLHHLDTLAPAEDVPGLAGVFLTHAHIGHYTGLMLLGHESMGARQVPVYAMPRMHEYLSTNGPWDQLVRYRNIELHPLAAEAPVELGEALEVTPILVPHRQEYSEVVAYRIDGPHRSALFLPDIDRWEEWDRSLEDVLATVDIAYLDGSFYANGEIPGRDMSGFPHPFITLTMDRLAALPPEQRGKVRFIHFNHTNPVLDPTSAERAEVAARGFGLAEEGDLEPL